MPYIFDNIKLTLLDTLTEHLKHSYRADFCVGYFNLRGWLPLAREIDQWTGDEDSCCRVLVGMQNAPKDSLQRLFASVAIEAEEMPSNKIVNAQKKQILQTFYQQLVIGMPTQVGEDSLRILVRQLAAGQVQIKLFLAHPLHAKLYLLYRHSNQYPVLGYLGSSNLTFSGLQHQGELNVDIPDNDATQKLCQWFEDRWTNHWCLDISQDLIAILEDSWLSTRPPYYIYLKMAYHLSQEARAGLAEFKVPTVFQKTLLEFQQKAVATAAKYLHKRGGVLIGDVVGLGKTITASALIKIFQEDFFLEALILCPKNLVTMWEDYVHQYQLHAKVFPHSRVTSNTFQDMRRYRLVVIDESHHLRNRESKRYRAIAEYVLRNESKVILLSATPYNKTYLDLSNQLRLFIPEDRDLGISPERYIEHIGGKKAFQALHQTQPTTLAAFEKSEFSDDWQELMRFYMVRRTRSFIKDNYTEIDPESGRKYLLFPDGRHNYFPERLAKRAEYAFDASDPNDQYASLYAETVVNSLNALHLPRYGLQRLLKPMPTLVANAEERTIQENLSRAGKRLMGFCRTNLFKRLESSGHAFLLSVSRHALRNYVFLHALAHDLPIPIGSQEAALLDAVTDELDFEQLSSDSDAETSKQWLLHDADYRAQAEQLYQLFCQPKYKKRFRWIRAGFFDKALSEQLQHDAEVLLAILNRVQRWQPDQDRQLNALHTLCTETYANEKILVFTQFADTARYLSTELVKRGVAALACVTGDTDDPTLYAHRFSPRSNQHTCSEALPELRLLITTDTLSEGQNLQDAHIVINYDLPWALIRLIQRAGRVDRLGQQSPQILCYSFLPEEGLEQIINLRARLAQRIEQNAEVVGSDEVFFEGDPVNIRDLYNEKSAVLDEEAEVLDVDLSSYAYEIWKSAINANPKLERAISALPDVVYSSKARSDSQPQGVIVYTRTPSGNDVLAWVDHEGQLLTQSQFTILKAAACSLEAPEVESLANHHALLQHGVSYIHHIEKAVGGQLGRKTSARYRVYQRLLDYFEQNKTDLFLNASLKQAIDDIYQYPLTEFARDTLNRRLKMGETDEGLADLVVSLREDQKLSLIHENDEIAATEPRIICSLGVV